MKNLICKFILLSLFIPLSACGRTLSDPLKLVNPFMGTGGHGHTFPGATVPFGMVQLSPDTRINGWDACSGYHYSDSTVNGFSHTHLSGTGCADYGDILFMPVTGAFDVRKPGKDDQQLSFCSPFSHKNEHASPGYYQVFLDRYGVNAELTSSTRVGFHKYTFPENAQAGIIIDMDFSLQNQENQLITLEVVNDREIKGWKKSNYWAFDQYIYFHAVFSEPFTCKMLKSFSTLKNGTPVDGNGKALLSFPDRKNKTVYVKVGISAVDCEGAKENLVQEIPDWNFEKVKENAEDKWRKHLSVIDVEDKDLEMKKVFYNSLYHTGISPNVFSDVDGRYRGMDMKIHKTAISDPMYTVFSLWDTFRAFNPLMTIIKPSLNEAFIRSLISKAKEGGVFPMWELAGNYTGTMIGYHAASLIADSYVKGYRNFDAEEAYKQLIRVAEYDTTGIICPKPVLPFLMPAAKYYKNKLGYVPCDKDNESVAKALEYAYDDWCIATLSKELGHKENYEKYTRFSKAYKWYFDASTGFMRGLDSDKKWRTPFNPRSSNHRNDDYCEGTAWQWTWFVPQDVDGLVKLMGGKKPFIEKLDSLFIADSKIVGKLTSSDISGLIGQYAHGNEPSHHIAHLYNYVGQPYKTQELVDRILRTMYSNNPDGISGNEDCGQMSAWFLMNSMGIYQVAPGKPVYSLGRPLFDKVTVNLENGKKLVIEARGNSRENKYTKKVTFNGEVLKTPFITHKEIAAGGNLVFEMVSTPQK